ncbi:Omp28-related outer membrane protein [Hoylesella loescheii]|uniref:Omp28-related outer membrane protein n=1 Tax=Hoylesella loescheii TaxID=840 RepID=UPI00248D5855|nr:Omp28-related outer membrane protein [Hoylesella loescheii]
MKKQLLLRLCALITMFYVSITAFAAFGENNLAPIAAPRLFVAKGATNAKGTFSCVNYGSNSVTSFRYKTTMNGKVVEEKDVKLAEPIKAGDNGQVQVKVPALNQTGDYQLVCEITLVNGKPNTTTFSFSTLDITMVTKVPTCRVVFEDYTATWCQYCPRATAIMEYLTKKHPNDFIGIAVHQGDPMSIGGYKSPVVGRIGLPYVWSSRTEKIGGNTGEESYQRVKARGAVMDIDVKAQWDASGKAIKVQSTTTFRTNLPKANYALAYVVIEDGVHNANWGQANAFNGETGLLAENKEFGPFVKEDRVVYGLKYNHVARTFLGIDNGLAGSLPNKVVADQAIKHEATFNGIGRSWTAQNKNNLRVVVMVIDNTTHNIANAARCQITPYATTAISAANATAERVEVARFNLNGQRLSAPEKGINIVKYSDGTVEKVRVRQ